MAPLVWDSVGDRLYETGVDHGVLYMPDDLGAYVDGVAWNGLTTVTESPTGAEASPVYADNIKYLNLYSIEEFGATIEAFTYPDEFAPYDGMGVPTPGMTLGQQTRDSFGLCYRTKLGNDLEGNDHGYKLHLIYGATASPSEKAYATINDSPEAISFSWDLTTIPVAVGTLNGVDYKPTAVVTLDSTEVDPTKLATLEALLYGASGDPQLPLPAAVYAIFGAGVTIVDLGVSTNQPTYVAGTHIVTLPTVTGVVWRINGVVKTPGAQPAMTVGQTAVIEASPSTTAYVLSGDTDWLFDY